MNILFNVDHWGKNELSLEVKLYFFYAGIRQALVFQWQMPLVSIS